MKAASRGCLVKQVTTVGKWSSVSLETTLEEKPWCYPTKGVKESGCLQINSHQSLGIYTQHF